MPRTGYERLARTLLLALFTSLAALPVLGQTTVFINEVDYDQPGTDRAEFIELYNAGSAAVALDPFTVQLVNGSNGTVYRTVDLPAVALPARDYFVICGDAVQVAGCDLDVSPDENLVQSGSPDAVALVAGGTIVDAVSYEGDTAGFTEGSGADLEDDPSVDFAGISRLPDGIDTDQNNADFSLRCGTPGGANTTQSASCPSTRPGPGPITRIHAVQGSGDASPLAGQIVTVEGLVVGDFQEGDGDLSDLDGFYVQEEASDFDTDEQSSEGIFVFAPGAPDVSPGDRVRVTGQVTEFSGLTELDNVSSVEQFGTAPVPAPVGISLPVGARADFERYEGMRVHFPQALVISEYFDFDRFGEIVLTLPLEDLERPFQATSYREPGPEAAAVEAAQQLRFIGLDDGRAAQNPDPARHPNGQPFTLDNRFRGGDLVCNAVGILDDRFGSYRIQPTEGAEYVQKNPRPDQPADVGGTVQVASFNVLNYFTTFGSRGADNAEEFARQRTKIIAALAVLDADVVGLIELENNDTAIQDLVSGLNDNLGAGTYDHVATGPIGTDEIKVGIIYKPAVLTPLGAFAVLDDPAFVNPNTPDPKNRPALAQTFEESVTGEVFTVVVNHFKSKGSPCGAGDDDPQQGSCNLTRTAAARVLMDWLATDPTGSGDPDGLIIGDLNAYDEEDPIDAIKAGADDVPSTADDYVDLVERFGGEFAYSFVFDGRFGYLDYALASKSLLRQVAGSTEWHIDADEPDILDFDVTFKKDAQDALFEPNAFRSSDHDPVLVGLDLDSAPPDITVAGAPVERWPPNHRYRTIAVADFVSAVSEGDIADVVITEVTSDEPENGRGDGNTVDDIVVGDCQTVRLRAERQGGGNGRVYTIHVAAADAAGLVGTASFQVRVPRSKKKGAVDDGAAYRVQSGCDAAEASPASMSTSTAPSSRTPTKALEEAPATFVLERNYPNPFTRSTQIRFQLPEAAHVQLTVYDMIGRVVARPVDGPMRAGHHEVALDASRLPSGVYFYRIAAGGYTETQRMVLLK